MFFFAKYPLYVSLTITTTRSDVPGKDAWSVVGYSSAESIDLVGLQEGLQQQLIYSRYV